MANFCLKMMFPTQMERESMITKKLYSNSEAKNKQLGKSLKKILTLKLAVCVCLCVCAYSLEILF